MSAPYLSRPARDARPFSGRAAPASRRRLLTALAALLVVGGALALAACGAESPGYTAQPTATAGNSTPGVTQTPGQSVYAYLFSLVNYPLQVPVNGSDDVTLTLSPHSNILTVTPTAGSGATTVGAPIPLPTDPQDYQDIGAAVDTQSASAATSPIVWQLTSAPRQSLLTPAGAGRRGYLDQVQFVWHVRAVSAGQNLIQITLRLYYTYLDGSEHDGSLSVTATPIPMVAVVSTPLNTTLPPLRLPIAGLSWLAGIIAAIRFIWGAIHTFHDITDPVKDIASTAQTIHTHLAGGGSQNTQQPQHQAVYPNPWTQRVQAPAGVHPPAAAPHAPAPNQPGVPGPQPGSQAQPPAGAQRPWPPMQ